MFKVTIYVTNYYKCSGATSQFIIDGKSQLILEAFIANSMGLGASFKK